MSAGHPLVQDEQVISAQEAGVEAPATPESRELPIGCDCLCHASVHFTGLISATTTILCGRAPDGFGHPISWLQVVPRAIYRPPILEAV